MFNLRSYTADLSYLYLWIRIRNTDTDPLSCQILNQFGSGSTTLDTSHFRYDIPVLFCVTAFVFLFQLLRDISPHLLVYQTNGRPPPAILYGSCYIRKVSQRTLRPLSLSHLLTAADKKESSSVLRVCEAKPPQCAALSLRPPSSYTRPIMSL